MPIEIIQESMSLTEIAVRASYQIVVTDNSYNPTSMGSGCIINYKNKLFFITVAHVTNEEDCHITIETNQKTENQQARNYQLGAMNFVDLFEIENIEELKKSAFSEASLKLLETLDFSFYELTEEVDFLQKEEDFGIHGTVPESTKIIIPGEDLTLLPDSAQNMLFYGRINGNLKNGVFEKEAKLTVDCTYIDEEDHFYKFQLPEVIKNASEFQGTSGAPIFDTNRNFLGLISYGFEGFPFIYAFKNSLIKYHLDLYIDSANS